MAGSRFERDGPERDDFESSSGSILLPEHQDQLALSHDSVRIDDQGAGTSLTTPTNGSMQVKEVKKATWS